MKAETAARRSPGTAPPGLTMAGQKGKTMKPLDNEKNLAFTNDPRRVAAQNELEAAVKHIRSDIMVDGNAMYYLTVLPPLLKKLETAYESLTTIEAKILCELEGKVE